MENTLLTVERTGVPFFACLIREMYLTTSYRRSMDNFIKQKKNNKKMNNCE